MSEEKSEAPKEVLEATAALAFAIRDHDKHHRAWINSDANVGESYRKVYLKSCGQLAVAHLKLSMAVTDGRTAQLLEQVDEVIGDAKG
jgi:mannose/cellobiose epimerase-like protein (N-acyl-D-glucosamine 2-epimerase family)